MIKELLAYQTKEKEKLSIIAAVERGKVKRELDEAKRQLESVYNWFTEGFDTPDLQATRLLLAQL